MTDELSEQRGDSLFYQVRRALTNLYDPIYLQRSPLVVLAAQGEPPVPPGQEARALRRILIEAIGRLSPADNVPLKSGERRSYEALFGRYVNQTPVPDLARTLAISERQLRRELRQGLDALTAIVAGLLSQASPEAEPISAPDGPVLREIARFGQSASAVNLCEEMRNVEALMASLARASGVVLRDEGIPESIVVRADRVLLRQALVGLYSWLISICPRATIEARISARDGAVAEVALSCQPSSPVAADGAVPAELLQALGATFCCHLTPSLEQGRSERLVCRLQLACMPSHRVLLVDDNEGLHQLFRRYLSGLPYRLLSAYSAEAGYALARDERPQVILLDIMMPNRDGWELLGLLREDAVTHDIPIVICSVLEQQALALSLSAQAYLRKPVDQAALLTLLQQFAPFDAA